MSGDEIMGVSAGAFRIADGDCDSCFREVLRCRGNPFFSVDTDFDGNIIKRQKGVVAIQERLRPAFLTRQEFKEIMGFK